jgi:hypothetical protein
MKNTLRIACRPAAVLCLLFLLFLSGCRPRNVDEYVAELPELPPDVAATLDANTLTTPTGTEFKSPEPLPVPPVAAPCCSSSETRRLKVNFPYTKCGSPGDIFGAQFDLASAALKRSDSSDAKPKLYKLAEFRGKTLPRINICISSQGPWDAVLTETRACSPYTPVYSLTFSAFGDAVVFNWTGSQSPPANVQVVSCRTLGTIRTPCGISSCTCTSEPCTVDASCQCSLELPPSQ